MSAASSCVLLTNGLGGEGGSTSPSAASSSTSAGAPSKTCEPVVPGSPSCDDCAKDGLETDVDCGGDACPPCALGDHCNDDADCVSGTCVGGRCAPGSKTCAPVLPGSPSCDDCAKDGLETDVDCGGDACPPCALGGHCHDGADCVSGACVGGRCAPGSKTCEPVVPSSPTCDDCVKDGLETDVDCGGDACPPCAAGKTCEVAANCRSGACVAGTCGTGQKGSACMQEADCASDACAPGDCWTGRCCG
jgi:hypothetical protein